MFKVKLDKADVVFSKWVRKRDDFRCQRCQKFYEGGNGLACMHYWSRRHENTRFEPDNALSGCAGCHQRLDADKQGEFTELMKKRLGEQRFKTLQIQANTFYRKDRKLQYMIFKKLLQETK